MSTNIKIRSLTIQDLDIAAEMAYENYILETNSAKGLSKDINKDFFKAELEQLLSRGTGRIAFENDTPIGFLTSMRCLS